MKKKFFLLNKGIAILILLLFMNRLSAQDVIVKTDNEQIKAKIIEIGSTEIRFKYFDAQDGPIVVVNRREVKLIRLMTTDGLVKTIVITDESKEDPMSTGNGAILNKTSSLKFNFFSPLDHQLAFSYEWMIKPGFNWEVGLGLVGLGLNELDQYNSHGLYLRTGAKFLLGNSSDVEIQGQRYAHPLKGKYFKVEAVFYDISATDTNYFYNYTFGSSSNRVNNKYLGAALNLIYGRQFIFGNSITVGYYAGVGYAFESATSEFFGTPSSYNQYEDYDYKRFAFAYFGRNFPITLTAGFNIGWIIKTPYWLSNLFKPSASSQPAQRHISDRGAGYDRLKN